MIGFPNVVGRGCGISTDTKKRAQVIEEIIHHSLLLPRTQAPGSDYSVRPKYRLAIALDTILDTHLVT